MIGRFPQIICCIFALMLAVSAGPLKEERLQVGIKGGLSLANIYGDDAHYFYSIGTNLGYTSGSRLGYPFGLGIQSRLLDFFGLGLDCIYSPKGVKFTKDVSYQSETYSITSTFQFNYLDIPLMAKFLLPAIGEFKTNVYAGPSLSLLLSRALNYKTGLAGVGSQDTTLDISYFPLNRVNYAVVFGIGGFVRQKSVDATIDLRCAMGLSSIDPPSARYVQGKIYNWQVYLLVGLMTRMPERVE